MTRFDVKGPVSITQRLVVAAVCAVLAYLSIVGSAPFWAFILVPIAIWQFIAAAVAAGVRESRANPSERASDPASE